MWQREQSGKVNVFVADDNDDNGDDSFLIIADDDNDDCESDGDEDLCDDGHEFSWSSIITQRSSLPSSSLSPSS